MNPDVNEALLGRDMFGEIVKPDIKGILKNRYLIPPFSVLSARDGDWQTRKRQWISLGIQSELGRGEAVTWGNAPSGRGTGDNSDKSYTGNAKRGLARCFGQDLMRGENPNFRQEADKRSNLNKAPLKPDTTNMVPGTSIFDPVLCELMYSWFCPAGGQIIDPFAGGSVRGIVGSVMGYRYWGCDLSKKQIEANRKQVTDLLPEADRIPIVVSGPMLRQGFSPCLPDKIPLDCQGRCCEGTDGIIVTIHETEREAIEALGVQVKDGFLIADARGLCPFKANNGLCSIHGREKPFGCQASPFTLNENGTLIVRNRYRMLRCYGGPGAVPVYRAHAWSLEAILGEEEVKRVIKLVEGGEDRIPATVGMAEYAKLVDNDDVKHSRVTAKRGPSVEYICGDSLDMLPSAPEADFIFTCPPYGDLEVYSNDPADLSTMDFPDFIKAYKEIIKLACDKLRPDRFACFVVGDFRDKQGYYKCFPQHTISGFLDAGLKLYNEIILVTSLGSLPIRITKQFEASKKIGKTHQNILVFKKT